MPRQINKDHLSIVIGAHVKGGIKGAVAHALEIGAQAMQIFIGSPQSWRAPSFKHEERDSFIKAVKEHALGPVYVHGNYLVNLASDVELNWQRSIESLRLALHLSNEIGASGLIFHPGSAKNMGYSVAVRRVISALEEVLADYKGKCQLVLEVCAGQGETIGSRFSQLWDIISALGKDKRLAVCWDTCHLYNAGYDISSQDGLTRTIAEFEEDVGLPWLVAIHANDSKTPLGARRDRHENIGAGYIGEEAFARMLQHPAFSGLPFILEVPGFNKKGPDRENIDILKRLTTGSC